MDTVSVAGVRIDAAAAAAEEFVFDEVVAAPTVEVVALALDFLLAGGAVAASDCCDAEAFRLRVIGAVMKDVLSADDARQHSLYRFVGVVQV